MLFDEQELQKELSISLSECKNSVVIFSAFIKKAAFQWFIDQTQEKNLKLVVVARWTLGDLLNSISDLEVYGLCKSQGWTFKIDQRLHSKLYLIDSSYAFIGSSNLTGAGLGLHSKSNFELSAKVDVSDIDLDKVNNYLDSCVTMTDELYSEIVKVLDNCEKPKVENNIQWPLSITTLLEQKVDYLWVDDLFFTRPDDASPIPEHLKHDLDLFGISSLMDKDQISHDQIKAVKWLKCQLLKEDSKSLRFGAVSKLLHDSLLNDPKPYRKDVKELQSNLFKWIKHLEIANFSFDKYNYSETISLTKEKNK